MKFIVVYLTSPFSPLFSPLSLPSSLPSSFSLSFFMSDQTPSLALSNTQILALLQDYYTPEKYDSDELCMLGRFVKTHCSKSLLATYKGSLLIASRNSRRDSDEATQAAWRACVMYVMCLTVDANDRVIHPSSESLREL
jgi:hypothetical protein